MSDAELLAMLLRTAEVLDQEAASLVDVDHDDRGREKPSVPPADREYFDQVNQTAEAMRDLAVTLQARMERQPHLERPGRGIVGPPHCRANLPCFGKFYVGLSEDPMNPGILAGPFDQPPALLGGQVLYRYLGRGPGWSLALFRTSDDHVLRLTAGGLWTGGVRVFHSGHDGLPVDDCGRQLDGGF